MTHTSLGKSMEILWNKPYPFILFISATNFDSSSTSHTWTRISLLSRSNSTTASLLVPIYDISA
uniref:Uncharacterized protein n=1 Tax=Picea glauca TaxID=3330 RepID=A0A101M4C5_PICGL|nr:hypothetical protein ABT39_MTgene516 [Picea glauca]